MEQTTCNVMQSRAVLSYRERLPPCAGARSCAVLWSGATRHRAYATQTARSPTPSGTIASWIWSGGVNIVAPTMIVVSPRAASGVSSVRTLVIIGKVRTVLARRFAYPDLARLLVRALTTPTTGGPRSVLVGKTVRTFVQDPIA